MNELTEYACSHCGNQDSGCYKDKWSGNCKYEVCSRDELIKRIVIAEKFAQDDIDAKELVEMQEVFINSYNGYAYDIYRYKLYHEVCGNCDGSGTVIGSHAISECKKCGGTGVIDRVPTSSQYTMLWFKFKRRPGKTDVSSADVNWLYMTREAAEEAVEKRKRKDGPLEIGELLISKNIIGRRGDQLTVAERAMKSYIDAENELSELVALTESDDGGYKIVAFGSWTDLHSSTFGYIAPYLDIEQIMNGRTVLINLDNMNRLLSIKTRESMNALYWNLLMNTIMVYCNTYVTYSGADKLITKYCGSKGICKNWDELRSNIIHHAVTNNAGRVTNKDGKKLAEMVQEDFRQYGITLPIIDAFGIVEKLVSIMGEDAMILNIATRRCDSLVVFMIEYVCISPDAEFNNLSELEDI